MSGRLNKTWTTSDELLYLQMIGMTSVHTQADSPKILLTRYQVAAMRRQRWGEINKNVVMSAVKAEIKAAA